MRVTILGGTGFIGTHVTQAIRTAGAEAASIARGARSGAPTFEADRTNVPELTRALAAAAPAVVVDMIAYQQRDIEQLLSALPATVRRVVVISSGDVYAAYGRFLGHPTDDADLAESDESSPVRQVLFPYRTHATNAADIGYAYEKILVERAATAWRGGHTTILRLPMVYGPADPQRRVAGAVERLEAANGTLRLNPVEAAWRTTRGYVEDVAAAIALATVSPAASGQTLNVGEPDALSELEWLHAVGAAATWPGTIMTDPRAAPSRSANWTTSLAVRTRRIRDTLGYVEPIGRLEGLRRTVAALASGERHN